MSDRKNIRRFPRRKFRQAAGLLIGGKYFITNVLEIGEGGMLIKLPLSAEMPVAAQGTNVVVAFFIPLKGFISVLGEVAYIENRELMGEKANPESKLSGIKFLDLEFDSKRLIRDYIALKTSDEALEGLSS